MAERRMFAKSIIDSDAFLDMPATTQLLYFHLGMRADDDGFVDKPRSVMRMIGGSKNDLDLLFAKQFLIPFESGVVVIKHWKIHNYIRKDRYSETIHLEEKAALLTAENGIYTAGLPDVNQRSTNGLPLVDPGKDRLGKGRLGKGKESTADKPPTRHHFSPPTVEEVRAYCDEKKYSIDPQHFVDYYTSNGWRVGKNPMKDWEAAVRSWSRKEMQSNERVGKTEFSNLGTIGTVL